jgi:hypothetical protein
MASAEIAVTVGADTTQLEKGLNDVTKAASTGGGKATAQAGGFISTLGRAYGQFQAIFAVLSAGFDFVMKYATMARELRNMSVATGIPIAELRKFELQAKQAGISTSAMAHSVAEFNKKMGEAKIRGSEANAAMAKLGVGLSDIQNGTFKYNDALMALAASYEAGTDDATLMHYGIQLFGSSFEQLLPLVKKGTVDLKKGSEAMVGVNKDSARGLSSFADSWDNFSQTVENSFINIFGGIANAFSETLDVINNDTAALYHSIFSSSPEAQGKDYADDVFKQMSKGLTKEEQKAYFKEYGSSMVGEARAFYEKRINELTAISGKKLTPQGLTEAQGASSIQQMGGGDIVSAIAFTPMERIAMATEETARNTDPSNQKPATEYVPGSRGIVGLSF